jgi:hypothetical protein
LLILSEVIGMSDVRTKTDYTNLPKSLLFAIIQL